MTRRFPLPLVAFVVLSGCTCKRNEEAPPSKESPAAFLIELPSDLDVPRSTTKDAAPHEGIPIYVSRSAISVGWDRRVVAELGDRDTLANVGVDTKYKGTDPSTIRSLQDAVEGVRKEKGLGAWIPAAIAIDASTPFKVVGEVIVTVQQLKFDRYSLVVKRDDGSFGAIELGKAHAPTNQPPAPAASADAAPAPDASIYFGVRIVGDGYAVRAFSRELSSDCSTPGAPPAVAKKNGAYDPAGLSACAEATRAKVPRTHDSFALISAAPKTAFSEVVAVIDAVRATPTGKPLFPDVGLSVVH